MTFSLRGEFDRTEATAQANDVGVWGYEAPATTTQTGGGSGDGQVTVTTIHADAAGNDHTNENDGYITFTNTGDGPLDLSGWSISDAADHTYHVPTGVTLDAGDSITLYTGSGQNTATELYWGSDAAIWNNDGDTIIVTDDSARSSSPKSTESAHRDLGASSVDDRADSRPGGSVSILGK